MALQVEGTVSFTVDGPGGQSTGTVVGSGGLVRIDAQDPVAVWDAALGSVSTGPEVLSTVADLISSEGLLVEVHGPDGLLASVGAGVDSVLGRVLTGSRRVRLGRPAAVRPLAVAELRRRPALLAAPLGALVLIVGAVVALRRR